jgi:hypothetical protein
VMLPAEEGLQRCCNHDFQVPFRENLIRVLPVQYLALFGDADVSAKGSRWLRNDRAMCRTSSASNGSARPWNSRSRMSKPAVACSAF